MTTIPKLRLNNGLEIPVLGQGSGALDPTTLADAKNWLLSALKSGFRHIDTAKFYGTEAAVGEAIRESGIPREEIWVSTKLPWYDHSRVQESFKESFDALGLEYIDMYMIHSPTALEYDPTTPFPTHPDGSLRLETSITYNQVWGELEKILDTGKVKCIGVCNFSIKLLDDLLKTAKVVPAVNQVEIHPYLLQNALRHYCAKKGIVVTAYTPSGHMHFPDRQSHPNPTGQKTVRENPLILSLAEKYKISPNQVIIAWHISRGQVLLPTSQNAERQKENLDIKHLAEEDLAKIWDLDRGQRITAAPDASGKVFGYTLEAVGWESYYPKLQ